MVDGANGICLYEEWHFSRAVITRETNTASRRVEASAEIWKHEGHKQTPSLKRLPPHRAQWD